MTQKIETYYVCAAQQPTEKTRQFETNSMRATVSNKQCRGKGK